jgi:hypothetical protein
LSGVGILAVVGGGFFALALACVLLGNGFKALKLWWNPELPNKLGPNGRPAYTDFMSEYYDPERVEQESAEQRRRDEEAMCAEAAKLWSTPATFRTGEH